MQTDSIGKLAILGALLTILLCERSLSAAESSALAAAMESVTVGELERHVAFLSADALEGRDAGSRGGQAASGYLVDELRKYRVAGGGKSGAYHQPVPTGGRNILALIPGSDENLKNEVIVLGAHYDHVGYGTPSNSNGPVGQIHNGADDNASGTAALLEIADAITRLPQPPRRTVLIAWWDGEEDGLLGAKHWLADPTLDRRRVVAKINLDMVGRLRNDRVEVYGTRTAAGLRRLVSSANAPRPLVLDYQWEMKDNSDHWPFYSAGIPTIMFHTGLHDDYHRPSDDAERVNTKGIRQVTQLTLATLLELASIEKMPAFRAASRGETDESQRWAFERAKSPITPRLGLAWSETDRQRGLLVTNVDPSSAAQAAGIRVGDRLLRLGHRPLDRARLADDEEFIGLIWAMRGVAEFTVAASGERVPRVVPVALRGKPVRMGISWRVDDADPAAVLVTQTYRGAPMARAGVRTGDRIYNVAGREFASGIEFEQLLAAQTGDFGVGVEREGKLLSLTVPPPRDAGEMPRASEP